VASYVGEIQAGQSARCVDVLTDKTINDTIISRYREIITSISRVSLPMKDKERLDSFVSDALAFITSVGDDESWLHKLCSRV